MTRMELLTPGWLTVSNDLPTGVHTISDTPPDDTACANALETIKAAKLLVLLELAAISPTSQFWHAGCIESVEQSRFLDTAR